MAKKLKQVITVKQIRELRAQLHHLKPTLIIGNHGITDSLIQEINRALDDHELIKIRVNEFNNSSLAEIANQICSKTKSVLVQTIGHIIAIYRKNPLNDET
jgi:RNA-binding protein